MHAIEKILAQASGKTSVRTGEVIYVKVDFAQVNDLYLQTIYSFHEMGGERVWDKNKLAFVFDHYSPCPTIEAARNHAEMRAFAEKNELKYHFDIHAGVCHQIIPEHGLVHPGEVIVATDSHTTTLGAFGAYGTGVGATDMAVIMLTGEMWVRVPEIIEIQMNGETAKGVYPKDVVLHVLGDRKADGAISKAISFTGSYIEQLDVAGRMVLCNMAVEMGAETAYISPNQKVLDYLSQRSEKAIVPVKTDDDYVYAESHVYDVTNLSPQVACPHSVDKVKSIEQVGAHTVHQGLIGTCAGGRVEDIAIAAEILRGKRLPRFVRLLVVPASAAVLQECIEKGYIQDFLEAGATIVSPGCGPCLGAHEGVLAPGEVCVSASNRNFPGRMGSTEASIYLASPATVAASVLNGQLTDPRNNL